MLNQNCLIQSKKNTICIASDYELKLRAIQPFGSACDCYHVLGYYNV